MARLPQLGGDNGTWGSILNEFLGVEHNSDGTLKASGSLNAKADKTYVDTGLAAKEPAVSAGTTAQYWRGDKSWQTLDKTAVGLSNIDNTSDANKPVSTAQAAADNLRVLKTGDAMTGALSVTVPTTNNALVIASTNGNASESVYQSFNGRARFGYNGTDGAISIDDNSTAKTAQFVLNSARALRISGTAGNNGANFMVISNGAANAGVSISTSGSDTNINITLTPKGSGITALKNVQIATGAAAGSVLTSDASGNATWQAPTANGKVLPNVQTASYTLALADAGAAVEMNNASALTLTVPPFSSVAFAVGTIIEVFQRGAGQVTIAPGAGVTIRSASGNNLRTQYSVATLRLSATNEWVLAGDLA